MEELTDKPKVITGMKNKEIFIKNFYHILRAQSGFVPLFLPIADYQAIMNIENLPV